MLHRIELAAQLSDDNKKAPIRKRHDFSRPSSRRLDTLINEMDPTFLTYLEIIMPNEMFDQAAEASLKHKSRQLE